MDKRLEEHNGLFKEIFKCFLFLSVISVHVFTHGLFCSKEALRDFNSPPSSERSPRFVTAECVPSLSLGLCPVEASSLTQPSFLGRERGRAKKRDAGGGAHYTPLGDFDSIMCTVLLFLI